jgi:hypothetical protein
MIRVRLLLWVLRLLHIPHEVEFVKRNGQVEILRLKSVGK